MGTDMMNLLEETLSELKKYGLNLSDVKVIFKGQFFQNESEIKKVLSIEYDNSWGLLQHGDIQLIVDDYTWIERTSYDGREKYILKAHPLLSTYENQEHHPGSI